MRLPSLNLRSIALRLIVAVLAVELLSAVLVVFLSYGYERHIHFHAFDIALHGRVDSILGAVQDAEDPPQDHVMLVQSDLHLPPDDIYQVYDANSRLLGRSANWQGVAPDFSAPPRGQFTRMIVNGRHYRVLLFNGSRNIDVAEPGGGKLRIEATNVDPDEGFARELCLHAGGYVRLAVSDTGTGLSEDAMAHLFESFFTTKQGASGAGLGLALSRQLVRLMGGELGVRSVLGRGSEFFFALPCLSEGKSPAEGL